MNPALLHPEPDTPARKDAASRTLVSIVINNYNYSQFLRDAIDSALAQTYTPCEVIVVDDGSTDNSPEIIQSYGTLVRPVLKANGGQASAFNAGFAASRGELVHFLDSDDYLAPEAISAVIDVVQPGTAVIQFPLFKKNFRDTGEPQSCYPDRITSAKTDVVAMLLRCGHYEFPPTSGNLFSRATLQKILPMPEDRFRICADAYLVVRAPFYGLRKVIERPLGYYRVHDSNSYYRASLAPEKLPLVLESNERKIELVENEAELHGLKIPHDLRTTRVSYLYQRLLAKKLLNRPLPGNGWLTFFRQLVNAIHYDCVAPLGYKLKLSIRCFVIAFMPVKTVGILARRRLQQKTA